MSSSSLDIFPFRIAIRADSPVLGFDCLNSEDPLHWPSPDFPRDLCDSKIPLPLPASVIPGLQQRASLAALSQTHPRNAVYLDPDDASAIFPSRHSLSPSLDEDSEAAFLHIRALYSTPTRPSSQIYLGQPRHDTPPEPTSSRWSIASSIDVPTLSPANSPPASPRTTHPSPRPSTRKRVMSVLSRLSLGAGGLLSPPPLPSPREMQKAYLDRDDPPTPSELVLRSPHSHASSLSTSTYASSSSFSSLRNPTTSASPPLPPKSHSAQPSPRRRPNLHLQLSTSHLSSAGVPFSPTSAHLSPTPISPTHASTSHSPTPSPISISHSSLLPSPFPPSPSRPSFSPSRPSFQDEPEELDPLSFRPPSRSGSSPTPSLSSIISVVGVEPRERVRRLEKIQQERRLLKTQQSFAGLGSPTSSARFGWADEEEEDYGQVIPSRRGIYASQSSASLSYAYRTSSSTTTSSVVPFPASASASTTAFALVTPSGSISTHTHVPPTPKKGKSKDKESTSDTKRTRRSTALTVSALRTRLGFRPRSRPSLPSFPPSPTSYTPLPSSNSSPASPMTPFTPPPPPVPSKTPTQTPPAQKRLTVLLSTSSRPTNVLIPPSPRGPPPVPPKDAPSPSSLFYEESYTYVEDREAKREEEEEYRRAVGGGLDGRGRVVVGLGLEEVREVEGSWGPVTASAPGYVVA